MSEWYKEVTRETIPAYEVPRFFRQEIYLKQVREIIVEQLGTESEEVQMRSTFTDDLGADSLDIVELIMAFEEEFNIEFPDELAYEMRTVGDVVDFLCDCDEMLKPVITGAEKRTVSEEYVYSRMRKSGRKFRRIGDLK